MKPYPDGYKAVPTDTFNEEAPYCQLGGVKDEGVWLSDEDLPFVIEIQVRVIPVWVVNETAQAKLDDYAPCSLYPNQSTFSSVRIESTGHGYFQKGSGEGRTPFVGGKVLEFTLHLPTPYLYQKEFLTQPQGRFIQGDSSRKSLWAYGATQVDEDFYPLVCSLESLQDETIIHQTSLPFWRDRGVHAFTKERQGDDDICFEDIYSQDQTRTFMESIEAGMSEINLELGINEAGKLMKTSYDSYRLMGNQLFYKRRG
jgi:hypothetical protein